MHYHFVWYIKSICPTKLKVNTVTNIEVIRQNVIYVSQARGMVICVSSDLNGIHYLSKGGI